MVSSPSTKCTSVAKMDTFETAYPDWKSASFNDASWPKALVGNPTDFFQYISLSLFVVPSPCPLYPMPYLLMMYSLVSRDGLFHGKL